MLNKVEEIKNKITLSDALTRKVENLGGVENLENLPKVKINMLYSIARTIKAKSPEQLAYEEYMSNYAIVKGDIERVSMANECHIGDVEFWSQNNEITHFCQYDRLQRCVELQDLAQKWAIICRVELPTVDKWVERF